MSTEIVDFDKWEAEQLVHIKRLFHGPPPSAPQRLPPGAHHDNYLQDQLEANDEAGNTEYVLQQKQKVYNRIYRHKLKVSPPFDTRKYCPEIQLDTLLADGGGGLLNLVAAVLKVKDDDTIAFVENKRFDQIVGTADDPGTKADRFMRRGVKSARFEFMITFVEFVLVRFEELHPSQDENDVEFNRQHREYVESQRQLHKKAETVNGLLCKSCVPKRCGSRFDQKYPSNSPVVLEFASDHQETVEDRRSRTDKRAALNVPCCSVCIATEEELGHKLKQCAKCRDEAERIVWFCGRECQKLAWTSGHKQNCGRMYLSGYSSTFTGPKEEAAPASYTPSSALQAQIDVVRSNPTITYSATSPPPASKTIALTAKQLPPEFLLHRDRAFATGDRYSIGCVFTILLKILEKAPQPPGGVFTSENLTKQFAEEYVVDMDAIMRETLAQRMSQMSISY